MAWRATRLPVGGERVVDRVAGPRGWRLTSTGSRQHARLAGKASGTHREPPDSETLMPSLTDVDADGSTLRCPPGPEARNSASCRAFPPWVHEHRSSMVIILTIRSRSRQSSGRQCGRCRWDPRMPTVLSRSRMPSTCTPVREAASVSRFVGAQLNLQTSRLMREPE